MERLRDGLFEILLADHPQTVRGTFYVAATTGLVQKREADYKTISRVLVQMRIDNVVPWDWLVDSTRLQRKPVSWSSIDEALFHTARAYRRDIWDHLPDYVELWSEKDTISGLLYEQTARWDVPLMIARGFASVTFLKSAADHIARLGRPTWIYSFGDADPSGEESAENIERRLREFAPDAEIHFERVAVTDTQIHEWDLPTRPTKTTDSRARKFGRSYSVEVEAIAARRLRQLAEDCITRHINNDVLDRVRRTEAAERETLLRIARGAA